jgi:hypothetical protein
MEKVPSDNTLGLFVGHDFPFICNNACTDAGLLHGFNGTLCGGLALINHAGSIEKTHLHLNSKAVRVRATVNVRVRVKVRLRMRVGVRVDDRHKV